jgi:hypothetical protein
MKRNWRRGVTWAVGLAVAGGGATFLFKLYEFVATANRGDLPGFAFATVFSYFIATVGFLCLALWAFLKGHYRDIEEPKHRLLVTEAELEAAGDGAATEAAAPGAER